MLILKSDSEVLIDQNENDGEEEEAVMDYGQQRERSDKDGEVFEVFSSLSRLRCTISSSLQTLPVVTSFPLSATNNRLLISFFFSILNSKCYLR